LTLTGSLQRSPLPSTSCCRALRVTSRNYRDVEYKYQNQIESRLTVVAHHFSI
jgi:hypothetical protein